MTKPTARLALALVAIATASVLVLTGSAAAKPLIGKDGKINACYRVKGKPKGELRVVKSAKARCRRGERKVAWVVSGAVGSAGAPGEIGATGHSGAQGSDGTSGTSSTATLEEKVLGLTERVKELEGITERVEDLEGILGDLNNAQLLAAVNSVPLVETLCGEVTGVIAQTNLLRGSVGSLVSTLSGSLLGPIFGSVGLPPALPETLSCPA